VPVKMPRAEIRGKSLLVLGGARSGKSRYAQRLAESSSLQPVLIATAEARDAEMAMRIKRHMAGRGVQWTVVEEPVALVEALWREARKDRIVVVDYTSAVCGLKRLGRKRLFANNVLCLFVSS
jgi:adenosyl cobinamide kinase/adenosyl cobinamide phosphate guanylyltransferase